MPSILTLADLDFCDQLARRLFLRPLCTTSFSFAVPEIALAVELSLCVHVRPRVVFICQSAGREREITDCHLSLSWSRLFRFSAMRRRISKRLHI